MLRYFNLISERDCSDQIETRKIAVVSGSNVPVAGPACFEAVKGMM